MNKHILPNFLSHEKCPTCLFNTFEMPSRSFNGLKYLLSSNDPPSNANDIIPIRLVFKEASTTLKDLISATRDILGRMEDIQAVVDDTIRDISSVLHPVRSLPDDILSTIFQWCAPYAHPPALNHIVDSLSPDLPPWSLSQVCRRWRALVLSSPILWSTLSIPLDSYTRNHHPQDSFRLALHLQRSSKADLDVVLQEYDPINEAEEYEDDVTELPGLLERYDFLQLLFPTIPRWRGLDVYINDFHFHNLFDSSFPRLRRVTLLSVGILDDLVFRIGHKMDGLTDLTLGSVQMPAYDNIRVLTCCWNLLGELPKMLSLEVLRIDNTFQSEGWLESRDASFVLPNLHTVSLLKDSWMVELGQLFRYLIAPALRTLKLKFLDDHEYEDGDISYPHETSLQNLSNLSVEVIVPIHNETIAFIARTTSVSALYLGPENAIPDVLEPIGTHLLPKLTSLRIHLSTVRKYTESVMSTMESRRSSSYVASLEEVRLIRSGRDEWYTVETIEEMKENTGLLRRWAALRETMDVFNRFPMNVYKASCACQ